MSAAKLTPWFPADVKPVHNGVYQRTHNGREYYSYWNGSFWGAHSQLKEWAMEYRNTSKETSYPLLMWRGLAEKP